MLPEPGETIGKYTVVERIADGSKSVLFKAQHATLASSHALKILAPGGTGVDKERTMREAQAQAQLRHDNILEVTDVLEIDGRPCLVMPFIEGNDLRVWLSEDNPPVDERLRVFARVVRGVREAHRMGMVHRDLKPSDILMDRSDGKLTPKVADFGMVKLMEGRSQLTEPSMRMGEPMYTAPEQVQNPSTVDERADVFSLGCILYEMLCGKPPFAGGSDIEILGRMIERNYDRPDEVVPGMPIQLVALVEGMLEPDKENRVPSCEQILTMLKDVPETTGQIKRVKTASKPKKQSSGALMYVVAGVFTLLLVGFALAMIAAVGLQFLM